MTFTLATVTIDMLKLYLKNKVIDDDLSILCGEILHVRCIAHILDRVVPDNLRGVHGLVARVISFVRSSPLRLRSSMYLFPTVQEDIVY